MTTEEINESLNQHIDDLQKLLQAYYLAFMELEAYFKSPEQEIVKKHDALKKVKDLHYGVHVTKITN